MTKFIKPFGDDQPEIGDKMIRWANELYPIRRSISGPGVRATIAYLKGLMPDLKAHAIPTGTEVFDWKVPDEWTLRDAFVEDKEGNRIIDIADHGLHVVGYSEPVDKLVEFEELQQHLYSLDSQPEAIPYVTSYYERRWGFCLSQKQRESIKPGTYRVKIDADLGPGVLNYADLVLPGQSPQEIMLSTYICHPMMANNELSGPVVAAALAQWLAGREHYFTYRFVFLPETIGSLIYLSRHLEHLKGFTVAGFVLTCIGDERSYSLMPSRTGATLADRIARHVLNLHAPGYTSHSFLDRGSDERQYCSPLVDLPFVSIMRSKYGTYPEYHTSLDDFSIVTQAGLEGGLSVMKAAINALEVNETYRATMVGEPQLGRRKLYPSLSKKGSGFSARSMLNLLAYSDGAHDLLSISEIIGLDIFECHKIAMTLLEHGLLEKSARL